MTTYFDVVAPSERLVLTFDFAPGLDPGESLTRNPTIAVTVDMGIDPDAALVAPYGAVAGSKVLVPVSRLKQDVNYRIAVTCETTNIVKTLTTAGILPVRRA